MKLGKATRSDDIVTELSLTSSNLENERQSGGFLDSGIRDIVQITVN